MIGEGEDIFGRICCCFRKKKKLAKIDILEEEPDMLSGANFVLR